MQDQEKGARQALVTLHDVAAAAGVSKSTVSRILDERLPRSESETAVCSWRSCCSLLVAWRR